VSPKLAVFPIQRRFGSLPWTEIPARHDTMDFTTGS
jgi:hypothetical protein